MLYYVSESFNLLGNPEQLSLYHNIAYNHDPSIPVLFLGHVYGGVVEVLSPDGVFQLPIEYLAPCERLCPLEA